MGNARLQKRLLEKARQDKAAAKRERRQSKAQPDEALTGDELLAGAAGTRQFTEAETLAALAAWHARYDDGAMSLDEFEQSRAELIERLHVG